MEPKRVRATIIANPDCEIMPDFMKEFIGKTGEVVWAAPTGIGDTSIAVHLDVPHSKFGNFCRSTYTKSKLRKYSAHIFVEPDNYDNLMEMAKVISGDGRYGYGSSWTLLHDKDGEYLDRDKFFEVYKRIYERFYE